HGHTKRTSGCDYIGPHFHRLFGPFHIDILIPFFGFFEHLRPARTTTESTRPTAFHFHQFGIQLSDQLARGFVHSVCPAQVTGVVESNPLSLKLSAFHTATSCFEQI